MSNILAVFDIGPPLDSLGRPLKIGNIEFTDGVTRPVQLPFPVFQSDVTDSGPSMTADLPYSTAPSNLVT